jgi:transcriptional regulator with XRE-family HTH domain
MLKEARQGVALSQRALARLAGVAQPTVARIESGVVIPRVDTLDRLLRACGKDLELVERAGGGLDRTLIRERLKLSRPSALGSRSGNGRTHGRSAPGVIHDG